MMIVLIFCSSFTKLNVFKFWFSSFLLAAANWICILQRFKFTFVFSKGGFPQLMIKPTALFTANHHFRGTFFRIHMLKEELRFIMLKNMWIPRILNYKVVRRSDMGPRYCFRFMSSYRSFSPLLLDSVPEAIRAFTHLLRVNNVEPPRRRVDRRNDDN